MSIADPPAILSESEIDVTVEPPGPFVIVPDIVLEAVGNAGLYQALSTLQVLLNERRPWQIKPSFHAKCF